MTVLSPRHAPAALVLMVLSAIPVWLHAAAAPVHDDCADPEAVFEAAQIGGARRTEPTVSVPNDGFFEGRVPVRTSVVSVRVVRSFVPFTLYWTPTGLGFDRMIHLQSAELRRLQAGDDVLPVHWRWRLAQRGVRVEAYLYVHGGRPVRHPIQSGLALALPQLASGTRPITILLVSGGSAREKLPQLERDVERWLVAAWRELEAACGF